MAEIFNNVGESRLLKIVKEYYKIVDDIPSDGSDHVKTLKGYLRPICLSNYMRFYDCKYDGEDSPLVYMSSNKTHISKVRDVQLYNECNGIILDTSNGNILVYPGKMFTYVTHESQLRKLHQSTVSKIYDGTTVSLYYYNEQWRISNSNGYNISAITFMENYTFMDFLKDTLEHCGASFDNFDKGYSYNITFTNPNMHLFSTKHEIHLINVWNISKQRFSCKLDTIINGTSMKPAETVEFNAKHILDTCKGLTRYNDSTSSRSSPVMGYILRSDNLDRCNYIIESDTMRLIKHLLYDYGNYGGIINANNRLTYLILRIFMQRKIAKESIKILFPHMESRMNICAQYFRDLEDEIIAGIRNPSIINSSTVKAHFIKTIGELADISQKKDALKIINDLLIDMKYLPEHLEIFTHKFKEHSGHNEDDN
jgi:hypothetical protein